MHWVVGRRRRQHESAVDAARRTARATRLSAAVALITALGAVSGVVGAELLDTDSTVGPHCTVVPLSGTTFMFDCSPDREGGEAPSTG
jgi:hypothetical protein